MMKVYMSKTEFKELLEEYTVEAGLVDTFGQLN
jgi:hypothetical protein